jgi:nitrate reductase cytochrome c-type subunit
MNKLLVALIASLFAVGGVFAADAATPAEGASVPAKHAKKHAAKKVVKKEDKKAEAAKPAASK